MLGDSFLELAELCRGAFSQERTFFRAVRMAVGLLCAMERGTTSRAILALGGGGLDWSADYRLCSRSPWNAQCVFNGVLSQALTHLGDEDWCAVAYDDTRLSKTGKKIKGAQYHRDPLSPPFHKNLMYGFRFLQASILLPLHTTEEQSARAIPIRFELAPCAKKPGRKGTPEQWECYRKEKVKRNLSLTFKECVRNDRTRLDDLGQKNRLLLVTVDGGYCNRKCLADLPERTAVLGRIRKDAKLCHPVSDGTLRRYSKETFTPESVRQNDAVPYVTAQFVYGGAKRELRYKCVKNVRWQGGTKTRPVTLLVLAPIPYNAAAKRCYRDPAFLLCTETELNPQKLIQAYLDRWQIEVNHKEEKHILGVGQAQVWSPTAIPRQPALAVAAYSLLMLAALNAYGPGRGKAFPPLPKWRTHQRRPSLNDLRAIFREEFNDPNSKLSLTIRGPARSTNLVQTPAA